MPNVPDRNKYYVELLESRYAELKRRYDFTVEHNITLRCRLTLLEAKLAILESKKVPTTSEIDDHFDDDAGC